MEQLLTMDKNNLADYLMIIISVVSLTIYYFIGA
jgi:hypothetical protein